MSTLVSVRGVTKRFGDHVALDDVTLDIETGSIVGLLGPNGAGKSTLLSLIAGTRSADAGQVELLGGSPRDPRNRRALGSTPQETSFPDALRVGEVIDFVGRHFPERYSTAELAEEFGLTPFLRRQTGALSGGQRRRLAVALAFVGRPKLVLLDEPTTGLDVQGREALWAAVRRQRAAGATIIVTSHYLEEIEALAERVVVIGAGRVVADDALPTILRRVGQHRLSLRSDEAPAIARAVEASRVETDEAGTHLFFVPDPDAAVRTLVRSELPFSGLSVRGATLEEAFLILTDTQVHPDPISTTQTTRTDVAS